MKKTVKFTSLTTGFTTELALPYFNSLLEAQQYLIQLSANIARVSADMLNSNTDATTHKNIIQNMIPSNVSACIGINALVSVSPDNASCVVQSGAHLFIHTNNNFNLDADTYSIGNGSTSITLTNLAGGWGNSLGDSYYAVGVRPGQPFFPANNLVFCNSSSGNIGASNINMSMAYYLFLPCVVLLTDGTLTLQFIKLENKKLYAWYNSSTRKFVPQNADWFTSKVFNTYYILDNITVEQPTISGDPTADIDTETGASESNDSEDNVGGDGHVTLINNVVNYDNYSPNYSRLDTGFITAYEISTSQLVALHSFLYSETITDMIKNFFAGDASKAIIDLFNIPVAPNVEAASSVINIGVISSGASANAIQGETVTFDFGSIDITANSYYSNSFMDLSPYNQYSIYLPYIGFRNLSTNDVRSINDNGFKIYLKYVVDVLTGDFVAIVEADHNNCAVDNDTGTVTTAKLTKQLINVYNGSMRTDIPLSYRNPLQGLMPIMSGLASTMFTMATASASGATDMQQLSKEADAGMSVLNNIGSVNNSLMARSDSISGSVGNLSLRTAFIINQECPKYIRTGKSNQFSGYPVYKFMKLNDDRGFVKVRNVIASNFPGTAHEQEMVVSLLKKGVWCK